MDNELRTQALITKYQFEFEKIDKSEIRALIQDEIARYQKESAEYIRCLCGYLFCIGDETDVPLIEAVKYGISMDIGCMIDEEWIHSLQNGGVESLLTRSRSAIIEDFILYYRRWANYPLETVLLQETPGEDRAYRKTVIWAAAVTGVCSVCFLAMTIFGVVCSFETLALLWSCILPALLAVWTGYIGIACLCSRRQYIRVYADRIVYRKQFQKSERIIYLQPQDYKIKLYHSAVVVGSYPDKYVIELVFLDAKGEQLFSYKAPTFHRSPWQSPRRKWEDDLLSLGCEIIDYGKIIVNE